MKRYNFGCGTSKIDGWINVDVDRFMEPDEVMNLLEPLPIESNTVDAILLIHTIEHIPENFHELLLLEFHRILIPLAPITIAYPEFKHCARNYIENYRGQRDFWKATLYGRQLTPSDYHVALMDTDIFAAAMLNAGFTNVNARPEVNEPWNTIITAQKGEALLTYEQDLAQEIFR